MAITDPEEITNLVLWLEMNNPSCLSQSGGSVTNLADLSAHGQPDFSLIGGTAPTVGAGSYHGHDVLELRSSLGTIEQPTNPGNTHNDPCTTILFFEPLAAPGGSKKHLLEIGTTNLSHRLSLVNTIYQVRFGGNNIDTSLTYAPLQPQIVFVYTTLAGPYVECFDMNTSNVAANVRTSNTLNIIGGTSGARWIFGESGFDYNVMAHLVYDRAIDTVERDQIVAYFETGWASAPVGTAPAWGTINNHTTDQATSNYNVAHGITTVGVPAPVYSTPTTGFNIPNSAVAEVQQNGATIADHTVTVQATNASGSPTTTFQWDVTSSSGLTINPPTGLSADPVGSVATLTWKGPQNLKDTSDPVINSYLPYDDDHTGLPEVGPSGTAPTLSSGLIPARFGTKCCRHYTINTVPPNEPSRDDRRSEWSDKIHNPIPLSSDLWWSLSMFWDPTSGDLATGGQFDNCTQVHYSLDYPSANFRKTCFNFGRLGAYGNYLGLQIRSYPNLFVDPGDVEIARVYSSPLNPGGVSAWTNGDSEPTNYSALAGTGWHDIVVHYRPHHDDSSNPLIELWFDGRKIVTDTLANTGNEGANSDAGWPKHGVYNDQDSEPPGFFTLRYTDEYRIGYDGDYLDYCPVGCTGFEILDNADQVVASVNSNVESYDITGLSNGNYTYKVRATYDRESTDTPTDVSTSVSVNFDIGGLTGPVITVEPVFPTIVSGQYYESVAPAATGTLPITWAIDVNQPGYLPTGLSFDTSTGVISGTPSSVPVLLHQVTLTATNVQGPSTTVPQDILCHSGTSIDFIAEPGIGSDHGWQSSMPALADGEVFAIDMIERGNRSQADISMTYLITDAPGAANERIRFRMGTWASQTIAKLEVRGSLSVTYDLSPPIPLNERFQMICERVGADTKYTFISSGGTDVTTQSGTYSPYWGFGAAGGSGDGFNGEIFAIQHSDRYWSMDAQTGSSEPSIGSPANQLNFAGSEGVEYDWNAVALPTPPTYSPVTVDNGTSAQIDHDAAWSNVSGGGTWGAAVLPLGRSIDSGSGLETGTYTTNGVTSVVITYTEGGITYSGNPHDNTVSAPGQVPTPPTYTETAVDVNTSAQIDHAPQWQNVGGGGNWTAVNLPSGRDIDISSGIETGTYDTVETHLNTTVITYTESAVPYDSNTFTSRVRPIVPSYNTVDVLQDTSVQINHAALWGDTDSSGTWSDVGLPVGRSIDAAGLETGNYDSVEAASVTITHTSGGVDYDSAPYTVNVTAAPVPPSWTTPLADQNTAHGSQPTPYDFTPADGSPAPTYSIQSAPTGFSITDSVNGVLTANGAAKGQHSITIRATNTANTADDTLLWDLNAPPIWGTIPPQTNQQSAGGTLEVSQYLTDSGHPSSVAYDLVTPPTGFTISGSTITCAADTPTVAAHPITVRADNGDVDDFTFTWDVTQTLIAPSWDTPLADQNTVHASQPTPYDFVQASGTPAPTYSIQSAPTGFDITNSTTGELTANGAAVGSHAITLTATNAHSSANDDMVWELTAPATWLVPMPTLGSVFGIGDSYDLSLAITDAGYPTSITYSVVTPPDPGFTITAGTFITGDPSIAVGGYDITVRADNGVAADTSIHWDVAAAAVSPTWDTPVDDRTDRVGDQTVVEDFTGKYSGSPAPAIFLEGDTTGFVLVGDTVEARTAAIGDHDLILRAQNSAGESPENFRWTITAEPTPPPYGAKTSYNGVVVNWDASVGWENVSSGTYSATGLPTDLTMAANGVVSGTPTANGTWANVVVTYDDGQQYSATAFSWQITDVPPAPTTSGGGMALRLNLMI